MKEQTITEKLPNELISYMLNFLNTKDLLILSMVSKFFNVMVNNDESLWKTKKYEEINSTASEKFFRFVLQPQKNQPQNSQDLRTSFLSAMSPVNMKIQVTLNESEWHIGKGLPPAIFWSKKIEEEFSNDITNKQVCKKLLSLKRKFEMQEEGEHKKPKL